MRNVADMQQQIGLQHLFQCGAEGGDQLGRQVGDEADGVGDDFRPDASFTRRMVGVERREQQVAASTLALVRRLNRVDLPALV